MLTLGEWAELALQSCLLTIQKRIWIQMVLTCINPSSEIPEEKKLFSLYTLMQNKKQKLGKSVVGQA